MASRDEVIQMTVRAKDEASATLGAIQDNVGRLGLNVGKIGQAFTVLGGIAIAQQLGSAAVEMARVGAVAMQVESALGDLAANAGTSAEKIVSAMDRAAMGTISQYELMLQANRALQFEIAKTPEEMAKLVELATALGRATGRSDTDALNDLVAGISRESKLILDNLSIIVDIDKVTSDYAATLGTTAGQLTSYQRKQALLNEAYRQGEAALKANADAVDSAATRFERLDASLQNAKTELGALFAPAIATVAENLAKAAGGVADQLDEMGKSRDVSTLVQDIEIYKLQIEGTQRAMEDLRITRDQLASEGSLTPEMQSNFDTSMFGMISEQRTAQENLTAATNAYFEALRRLYPAQEAVMNPTSADAQARMAMQMMNTANAANAAVSPYNALNIAEHSLTAETQMLNGALAQAPGWLQGVANAAIQAGGVLSQVATQVNQLTASLVPALAATKSAIYSAAARVGNIVGDQRAVQLATQQVTALESGVKNLAQAKLTGAISETEYNYQLAKLNDTYTGTFTNIEQAHQQQMRLAKSTGSAAAATAQLSEEYSNLQSKVSSVLSGAFNVDVGVDTESILGREDAINEDARRLADVAVNGFSSPWYGYLKDKFPDTIGAAFEGADPKTAAAKLLKDFEDGLRPELINKDMAKERVRRMLIGEANTKAMIDEIAKELATEMGISINKVRAAAGGALGMADVATGGAAGDGVPVDIKPMIDQALLAPITNLTANPQNVTVTLDTATVDGTAIAGELAAKIALTLAPTITWTDENVNAAKIIFASYAFQAMPTITWDATMLTNAQTYISSVAFGIHPTIQFDDTNLAGAITSLQSYAFTINPFVSFANSIETAQTTFSAYAFSAYPTISWDATMLANAQAYIASAAFPIAPTLNFDATQLDTARTTLQSYGFVINPYVSFDPTNIEVAQTAFANYTFEAMPIITWDAVIVANAQTYISSIAFPINPTIVFDNVNVEAAKTTLQSHAFEVNPFVTFDDTNIETAKTTLQSHAFSVQPIIDFSADLANAQTRLQSYAFSIAPTINTGGEDAGSMAVNPTIAWDSANIETAKTMLASYLFTVNPYIAFDEANLALATEQFKSAFSPEIVPTISLFSADGQAVDFNTPAQMLAQGFTFAFMTEFDAFNPGQYVVEQLSAKIAENYQALDEGARGMGQRWGSMFLSAVSESVPIPLIELLVTLVTPAVKEKMSQEASQRGATYNPLPGG
jgi:hypothetical protein